MIGYCNQTKGDSDLKWVNLYQALGIAIKFCFYFQYEIILEILFLITKTSISQFHATFELDLGFFKPRYSR